MRQVSNVPWQGMACIFLQYAPDLRVPRQSWHYNGPMSSCNFLPICQALLAWVHGEPDCAEAWQLAALAAVQLAACGGSCTHAWRRAWRLCLHALHVLDHQAFPDAGLYSRGRLTDSLLAALRFLTEWRSPRLMLSSRRLPALGMPACCIFIK